MRLFIILFILLAGCEAVTPLNQEIDSVLSSCVETTTLIHDFIDGDPETATKYNCPLHTKMTCDYYKGQKRNEVRCIGTSPSDPQNAPAGCSLIYNNGVREFFNVGILFAAAYRCPAVGDLDCHYFIHNIDCNDSDADPTNDCDPSEDDQIHENLVCI